MDLTISQAVERPPKRQRLSPPPAHENQEAHMQTSFRSDPIAFHNAPRSAATDNIIDIRKYIAAGSLRIHRRGDSVSVTAKGIRKTTRSAIPVDLWRGQSAWAAFAHPRDVYHSSGDPYLPNDLQDLLLHTHTLRPFIGLHNAGWIRMEYRTLDETLGQARVYILPDDVGNRIVDRQQASLRRAMQALLGQLDISKTTWDGKWNVDTSVAHVDSELDEDRVKDDATLFEIFNTLPSPAPDPEMVMDPYMKDAMYRLLASDVEGLTTKMHSYQRRSAALMLQREAQPSRIVDPRLRQLVDNRGSTWYCDLDAGSCLREPRTYETAQGGICAETMGLGKTLICLALILATRELSSQIPVEYSVGTIPVRPATASLKEMCAAAIGRTGLPWKDYFESLKAEGYDYSQCVKAIRAAPGHYCLPSPPPRRQSRHPIIIPDRKVYLTTATLVIVPPNLVQQWRHEIEKHTKGLRILVMNDIQSVLPPASQLAEYDIILFSKQRFDKEARDGSDDQGRRESTASRVCQCSYVGATRTRECTCFKPDAVYHSPLKDLHFKRLITDEGHIFGNSSNSSANGGIAVVDYLQLTARWIVSGTPTQGLYGAEVAMAGNSKMSILGPSSSKSSSSIADSEEMHTDFETFDAGIGTYDISSDSSQHEVLESYVSENPSESSRDLSFFYRQERKDLEKLGNIATNYLKARPWANTRDNDDMASWSQYVMQPRHGSKSRGNMDCLRSTLQGMIIRHRPEDVLRDVSLPPLHQKVVSLDGSVIDKLSLNTFSMMITSNAVTSERKDADYLFHPKQRKALQELVSNLRQASFFWSGYASDDIRVTIDIAKKFLQKREVPVTPQDEVLLLEAINVGEAVLSNNICQAISVLHEMPMFINIDCDNEIKNAWALSSGLSFHNQLDDPEISTTSTFDITAGQPTLVGASMLHSMQKFVSHQLWKSDPSDGLVSKGRETMQTALKAQEPAPTKQPRRKSLSKQKTKKADDELPALAGGARVGNGTSPKKRHRTASVVALDEGASSLKPDLLNESNPTLQASTSGVPDTTDSDQDDFKPPPAHLTASADSIRTTLAHPKKVAKSGLKSALKDTGTLAVAGTLDPTSPLASASIMSTASSKLSYLMDRIVAHQADEKILIFYEAENVAYYIAQALECLDIKHLIYAKTLTTARRAQYVVTFNQSPVFRVLLMDVSQAAFGLDLSSASRVFFVNPVFSPQVEAQAVKRAHRIGQTKPVFVETLVLKGSIEEVILDRRSDMSSEEHNKCKNILDDQKMYEWIRNVRFIATPDHYVPEPEQMASLETPQLVFGRGAIGVHDPDADLIADYSLSPEAENMRRKKFRPFDDDKLVHSRVTGTNALREDTMVSKLGDREDTTMNGFSDLSHEGSAILDENITVDRPSSNTSAENINAGDGIEYAPPPRKRKSVGFALSGSSCPSRASSRSPSTLSEEGGPEREQKQNKRVKRTISDRTRRLTPNPPAGAADDDDDSDPPVVMSEKAKGKCKQTATSSIPDWNLEVNDHHSQDTIVDENGVGSDEVEYDSKISSLFYNKVGQTGAGSGSGSGGIF